MWGQPPRLSAERSSAGFLQVPARPPFSFRTVGGAHMARQKGFTLLELMIVVVLILVIAAIAIPSMREAQIHTNEASAVGSIRAVNQVEVQYQATYGGYTESLSNLGGADPC